MIHDLILRWLVTVLFALSAAECGLAIITQRRPWTVVVSHGLHFVMAAAMAAMAWPWGARLPTTGPVLFFLLAAGWFVTLAVVVTRTTASRMVSGYHGLMMLATAWMYAIMDDDLLPVRAPTPLGSSMPGMDMASMTTPASGGSPAWFSAVNWVGTVGFAGAAVFWVYRTVRERRSQAMRLRSLGDLGQVMMAGGMAVLFLATLFQI